MIELTNKVYEKQRRKGIKSNEGYVYQYPKDKKKIMKVIDTDAHSLEYLKMKQYTIKLLLDNNLDLSMLQIAVPKDGIKIDGVLRELLKADEKYVLALGGGTPLLEENRVLIKEAEAYVIFLKVSALDAYERLKDDITRPLLQGTNVKQKIESLLQMRNPVYETIADYVLLEDGKSLDDIFYELSGLMKNK